MLKALKVITFRCN